MKKRVSIITFIGLLAFLLISLFPAPSYSTAYDPAFNSSRYVNMMNIIEIYIKTGKKPKRFPKSICSYTRGEFVRVELGKVKYNHIFNEIKSEEQIADIKQLAEDVKGLEDCKKSSQLWYEYDQKWYAAERSKVVKARKAEEKEWANNLSDKGEDKYDTIIGGTFFSIPREYIWFGSRKKDQVSDAVNLLFHFPEMSSRPNDDSIYGNRSDIAGVLNRGGVIDTKPCVGFDTDECTFTSAQTNFVGRYTTCYEMPSPDGYRARWRKECSYKEGIVRGIVSVYDEDVGMYRIGEEGYYEGTPEFPTYSFICPKIPKSDDKTFETATERCDSAVLIDDNTFFYYSFPQRMFWEHRELQTALRDKIRSFIIERDEISP